jgi:uncharacterized membrane protein
MQKMSIVVEEIRMRKIGAIIFILMCGAIFGLCVPSAVLADLLKAGDKAPQFSTSAIYGDQTTPTWPKGNKEPKTRQIMHLGTIDGTLDGAFWGMLLGFIFFVPLLGLAMGAAISGVSGHLGYCGVDDDFIKQICDKVTEGTSGLVLLLGTVTADKVGKAFRSAPHFEIIMTNLTHEQEQKLREVFA